MAAARAAAAVPLRPQRMRESLLILDFEDANAEMRETAPKSPKSHSSRKMRVMYLVVGGVESPFQMHGTILPGIENSHPCYSGNVCYVPGIRNINQKMTRHGRDTMAEQPYWKDRKRRRWKRLGRRAQPTLSKVRTSSSIFQARPSPASQEGSDYKKTTRILPRSSYGRRYWQRVVSSCLALEGEKPFAAQLLHHTVPHLVWGWLGRDSRRCASL